MKLFQNLMSCRFRRKWESDLDDELQFHLEMEEQDNLRAGMNPAEARRQAVLKLGGIEQTKEITREQRFGFWLETLWTDVVYGFRMLRKTPAITTVCLITLALAIGACTSLFSILNGVVLRSLPYPEPKRLAEVVETNLTKGIPRIEVNVRNLEDWRSRATILDGIAAYYTMGRTISDGNGSEVILASQVSADFFRVFQTPPLMGRIFTEEEAYRTKYNNALGLMTSDPVLILSYHLWKRRFGSDAAIVGKTIILDRRAWKVVGVMPEHFAMPDARTALWIPWGLRQESARDQHFAGAVARLARGVSFTQAEEQVNRIADQLAGEYPDTNAGWNVRLNPLKEAVTSQFKQVLWFLLVAVGLVMMIACANIAILQLSKASARMQESSMRMALGASRLRLLRQYLVESFTLASVGGIAGFILAYFAIAGLHRFQPNLPRISEITIDHTVLFVSIAIIAFSALLFGLAPALAGITGVSFSSRNYSGSGSLPNPQTHRLRNSLVILEVALAVILLSSSAMLIRSFLRLEKVDMGFQADPVLVLPIFLDSEKYDSGSKSRAYYTELIDRLEKLPDVVSVGGATALPASPLGPDFARPVWELGRSQPDQIRHADVRMITTDYFRTLRIPVLQGRAFSKQDTPDSLKVVIINESLAKQIWGASDPIGKQLVVDYSTSGTYPYIVVGMVKDIRFRGPRSLPRAEIYLPHAQRSYLILNIAIRTKRDPQLMIGPVREVLRSIDPHKPAHNIVTLSNLLGATVLRDRYAMVLVSLFGLVSLMLASLGIYGVLAFFVRQKIQEIGIRLALGATRNQILTWVMRDQGGRLVLAGLGAGCIAAIAFSRLLSGILYEVSARDLLSLTAAALLITLTALAAAWIPARRASRIDPSIALRYE